MSGGQDWAAEMIDESDTGGGAMSEAKRLSDVELMSIRWAMEMPGLEAVSVNYATDLLSHISAIEQELAAAKETLASEKAWRQFKEAGHMKCLDCEGVFAISLLNPSSADPQSGPVCCRCLELASAKAECERLRKELDDSRTALRLWLGNVR